MGEKAKVVPAKNTEIFKLRYMDGDFFRLQGTRCVNIQDMFRELKQALRLPDYFGGNWDALDEMLNDLSWMDISREVKLVILDADQILKQDDENFKKMLDIFKHAANEWKNKGILFKVIFHCMESNFPGFQERLKECGIRI